MVNSNDFKTGMTIEKDNEIYSIIEFMHVKPGKGGAFVITKLRNLRTGSIVEKTFNAAIEQGNYEYVIGKIAGKDGITIKGVNVMNENNVHKSIDKAFKTAYSELLKSKE